MPLLLFLIIKVKTHLYLKPMRVTLTHIHLNQARMNKCIFYTCAPLLSYYPKKNARLKGASSGAKEFEKGVVEPFLDPLTHVGDDLHGV